MYLHCNFKFVKTNDPTITSIIIKNNSPLNSFHKWNTVKDISKKTSSSPECFTVEMSYLSCQLKVSMLNSINAIVHFTANYKLFVLQQKQASILSWFQHQSGFQHQSFFHEQQIPDAVKKRFINSYNSDFQFLCFCYTSKIITGFKMTLSHRQMISQTLTVYNEQNQITSQLS